MKRDFSNKASAAKPRAAKPSWWLWLVVLALHGAVLMGLDATLTVNRLAAAEPTVLEAGIVTERVPVPIKPKQLQPPIPQPTPPTAVAKLPEQAPPEQALTALSPTDAPSAQPPTAPVPLISALATSPPVPVESAPKPSANPQTAPTVASQPARVPTSVDLRYKLIKGSDSASASLIWKTTLGLDGGSLYEATLEGTYFGFSAFKQTSSGSLQAGTGLQPSKYSDKRRGKSEQAAHFEQDKKTIIFSNNRPQAALVLGSQDRASMFVQLASRLAAEPNRYAAGQTIAMPVASVDELEHWIFEVQASELLVLPIGELEAIKLTRRPRRAFDQMVELWLAPTQQYLPVRIRLTDSSGVSDLLLASSDKI